MPKAYVPKVVTANALLEGDAVWLTADDRWSPDMAEAELLMDAKAAERRLADAAKRQSEVAGPYLADAAATDHGPVPVHFREDFRARGPSNYFHGKQTEA
ncbi:Protein of unknown function [Loktanella fryxellensis]|uniref:DUF2849 domain-containing protein n=1 Tax=Loktanella fryxellensis TaxID=245187 RepID=A0A1H8GJ02_9RHOB|nr:DUF2849 domain-containing protein [Loktanella fryxellensis]SEN43779.1 Protein of unknown function [Loktanella fryxellensis]